MIHIDRSYKLGNCQVELKHNNYGPYMRVIDHKGVPMGIIGGTSLLMLRDELNAFFGKIGYDWKEHNEALKKMLIKDKSAGDTNAKIKGTAIPSWTSSRGQDDTSQHTYEGAD